MSSLGVQDIREGTLSLPQGCNGCLSALCSTPGSRSLWLAGLCQDRSKKAETCQPRWVPGCWEQRSL